MRMYALRPEDLIVSPSSDCVCSLWQALGERCRVCEKKLARSTATQSGKATRFWEGGKGCRDPKYMDRHDPHRCCCMQLASQAAIVKHVAIR